MQTIVVTGVSGYATRVTDDTERPSFGENLRKLREAAGFPTQESFAAKLGLKRPSGVSQAEALRGSKVPRASKIKKLAAALGVEPWQLLEGVETEIDHLRKRRDLLRHGNEYQSPAGGSTHEIPNKSHAGIQSASGADPLTREAPHAEARLREEIAELRAALETVAKTVVAFGAPEAPAAPAVAARKPRRRRGSGKRA